jgi:hypothetical protein
MASTSVEYRVRCLPRSLVSPTGSEGRGTARRAQHRASAPVLRLTRPRIQDRAVGISTSRTSNCRKSLAWRKCPKGRGLLSEIEWRNPCPQHPVRAAAGGGRVALARVAAWVVYRGHCTCLRHGDVRVEPRPQRRKSPVPAAAARQPWPPVRSPVAEG